MNRELRIFPGKRLRAPCGKVQVLRGRQSLTPNQIVHKLHHIGTKSCEKFAVCRNESKDSLASAGALEERPFLAGYRRRGPGNSALIGLGAIS